MALFQPVFVLPDVRSGIGNGTVDIAQDMPVSWRITGSSAMTAFSITICENDAASTELFTTGKITDGCPAYGTSSTGKPRFFSYTVSAAALAAAGMSNGNEYKLIIRQWWDTDESVTQTSASVFITRAAPTLSVVSIGTGGVIDTRFYTFSGSYAQAQGDVLNWFRWRIAYADDMDPLFDSGHVSGTMDISCYYDGFFTGVNYAVRLNCQTENGIEADTGWVYFSAEYKTIETSGDFSASCVNGTDAVKVEWDGIGLIQGTATGSYSISDDHILTLPLGSSVRWDRVGTKPMSFAAPWSVLWKGTLGYVSGTLFTIGQSGGDITLTYDYPTHTLTLSKGGTTLASQSGIINTPTVTAVLTTTALYLRSEYLSGGLYPNTGLYPATGLYPSSSTVETVDTFTLSLSYTQDDISFAEVGGYQFCDYFEIVNGTASADAVTAAITDGDYVPGKTEPDYMMADWTHGTSAGQFVSDDRVIGWALYRRTGSGGAFVKIGETGEDEGVLYDYGARSQHGPYIYYIFPVGESTYISEAAVSEPISPCWWNWTLMECEETADTDIFRVIKAFRFRYNIETGAMSNNNAPNILHNFTPYPKIQLVPQNYKSASLSGLIGIVDWTSGQPEYVDTLHIRDSIMALSLTKNPLFLKSRKGDLLRVRLAGAVSMQTADATAEQMQTMTLPWAEVGSAEGVSLYSTEYVGAQEPEGEESASDVVDTSDGTATEQDIRLGMVAYAKGRRLVGVIPDGNNVGF